MKEVSLVQKEKCDYDFNISKKKKKKMQNEMLKENIRKDRFYKLK